jgi:hypothetical protein
MSLHPAHCSVLISANITTGHCRQYSALQFATELLQVTVTGARRGQEGGGEGEAGQHQKNPKKCKVMDTLLPFFIRGSGCQYNGR